MLHVRKKSMFNEMSARSKHTKEERASRTLRLILLHAKDSIALPSTDFDVTCLCYRFIRSLGDEIKLWGSSRSESIGNVLDIIDKSGMFSDNEEESVDEDNDGKNILLLLDTLSSTK